MLETSVNDIKHEGNFRKITIRVCPSVSAYLTVSS